MKYQKIQKDKQKLTEYQTSIKNQLTNGIIEDLILFLNME